MAAIQTNLFGKLDAGVKKLIQSREYWAAFNYIGMFDAYVDDSNMNVEFKFLEDYLEQTNPPSPAVTAMGGVRYYDYLAKYYRMVFVARNADTNRVDQTQCLYRVNEFLLQNGYPTVRSLWQGEWKMMYFTEFFDQNHNVTDYIIYCPYTAQIRHLPKDYDFYDYAHFNQPAMKDVL